MPSNLLVILSDEHQARAMGCAGHPFVQTPHLDALAARGHASPMPTPLHPSACQRAPALQRGARASNPSVGQCHALYGANSRLGALPSGCGRSRREYWKATLPTKGRSCGI